MIPIIAWEESGWMDEAGAWIDARLVELGRCRSTALEQPHARPWSTVLRVPTTDGTLYFKAVMPALGHEPALTAALYRWRPDCIPAVLAHDCARGWLLLGDAGETLRSRMRSTADLHQWLAIWPLYAGLQQAMSARCAELLALGTLDRRLAVLPAQLAAVLGDTDLLRIDLPDGLSADEHARLRALLPRFERLCGRLASFGLPETLHHDDFHDANIFVRDGRTIFADWAESCVAHPFFTLVVGLRSIAYRVGLDESAPEIEALAEVYLHAWCEYAPLPDLRAALRLARVIGMANRALTWHRVMAALPKEKHAANQDAVPGWLQEFLLAVESGSVEEL